MKNSFNYSGFCKQVYSPLRNTNTGSGANTKSEDNDNPARSCPPYLMTTTPARHTKIDE